jgi:DNA-binding NtrC family response regulator
MPYETHDLRGSETILVIDDEDYVREMSRDILAPLGYEVLLAGDGIEGLKMFNEMKDRISLVVLDMIMPDMGGSDVFSALKAMKPEPKVLLCSGYSSSGFADIDKLMKRGANGFIRKPFSRKDIALAVRKALSD